MAASRSGQTETLPRKSVAATREAHGAPARLAAWSVVLDVVGQLVTPALALGLALVLAAVCLAALREAADDIVQITVELAMALV